MMNVLFDIVSFIAIQIANIFFQVAVAEVPTIVLRCISRDEAALAVAQKVPWIFFLSFLNTERISRMNIFISLFCCRLSRLYMKMHQIVPMSVLILLSWQPSVMSASLLSRSSLVGYVECCFDSIWLCIHSGIHFLFMKQRSHNHYRY